MVLIFDVSIEDITSTKRNAKFTFPRHVAMFLCRSITSMSYPEIGEAFGGRLENLSEVFHGVTTPCHIVADSPVFQGLDSTITIGRYHSWVVSTEGLPDCLEVTATSDEGQIMALQHKELPVYGIQFHPESVLTPEGKSIIKNYIEL